MPDRIPDGITHDHIIKALRDLDGGVEHAFGESKGYDVLFNGSRYPPKAVMGLAAGKILGDPLGPYDVKGGLKSKCFRVLKSNGFEIVAKENFNPFPDEVDKD